MVIAVPLSSKIRPPSTITAFKIGVDLSISKSYPLGTTIESPSLGGILPPQVASSEYLLA